MGALNVCVHVRTVDSVHRARADFTVEIEGEREGDLSSSERPKLNTTCVCVCCEVSTRSQRGRGGYWVIFTAANDRKQSTTSRSSCQ